MSCGISVRFQTLSHSQGQIAHALLTRPPLTQGPKPSRPFDLNVLCTPPAFILSQDQTLDIFIYYLAPQSPIKPHNLSAIESCSQLLYYFFKSCVLFSKFYEIRSHTYFRICLYFSSCCSVFKDQNSPSQGSSIIIPLPNPFVKTFFQFFWIFFVFCNFIRKRSGFRSFLQIFPVKIRLNQTARRSNPRPTWYKAFRLWHKRSGFREQP